jgi:hypothetical protein
MNEQPSHPRTQRIVLPNGRSVEVVRVLLRSFPPRGLHVCPACDSHLVQPVRWGEAIHGLWELALSCPNCGWLHEGTFDREEVALLEDRLDEGLSQMLSDLRRLTAANMADEVSRFAEALQADLILPEDF